MKPKNAIPELTLRAINVCEHEEVERIEKRLKTAKEILIRDHLHYYINRCERLMKSNTIQN